MQKEALLYEKLGNNEVRCCLCAHYCRIARQGFGFCGVRQNIGGVLYSYVYGEVVSANIDPIEKKPLYHFYPGHSSFSIAAFGCNFRCGFCQNWEISQRSFSDAGLKADELSSREIVDEALRSKCRSIAYTYTEPTVFFEYALETARLAKEEGLFNVFVTNGYMSKEALKMIHPYLDAVNVDLKSFRGEFYKKICKAALKPVLDSIRLMHSLGVWVEVTTLVVPGENDSGEEMADLADFIAGVDKNIPWHISRFYPDYKFTGYSPTPEDTLKRACEIGSRAGLEFVYAGNVYGWGSDTSCPDCGKVLIKREGFSIFENNIKENRCVFCNEKISGRFD